MQAPFHSDISGVAIPPECIFVSSKSGPRLRLARWALGTRGTVFIFTGRTEYAEKYGRIVNELLIQNYAVVVFDWRGQGLSERADATRNCGHVQDFTEYQQDVDLIMAASQDLPKPHLMLAHSMGGAIGLHALMREFPFAAAVFSAPMWDIALPGPLKTIARAYGLFANQLSGDTWLAPGQTETPYVLMQGHDGNVLTSDPKHYDWMRMHLKAHPELGLGGPSVGWIRAALDEINMLSVAPPPATPILCLLGQREQVVSPSAIRQMQWRLPHSSLHEYTGAQHEILMERPAIRSDALNRIFRFFDDYS